MLAALNVLLSDLMVTSILVTLMSLNEALAQLHAYDQPRL